MIVVGEVTLADVITGVETIPLVGVTVLLVTEFP